MAVARGCIVGKYIVLIDNVMTTGTANANMLTLARMVPAEEG